MIIVKNPKGNLTLQQKFTYWKKSTLVLLCMLLQRCVKGEVEATAGMPPP